jgi:hypothetical protein
MENEQIETKLGEKINTVTLIKETSCSFIYHIKTNREYVLKKTKSETIEREFDNHEKMYGLWFAEKKNLSFRIPEIFFLNEDKKAYLMEYISDGKNLLEILLQKRIDTVDVFYKTGACLNQYHGLATKYLAADRQNINEHNTIKQLLNSRLKNKVTTCLDIFSTDTYRTIFKDFSPSNIVADNKGNIYFLDFQNLHYYAPFYYDLARFIDTTKAFTLVRKPIFYMRNFPSINKALNSFLDGYGVKIDNLLLKKMQYLHRKEHIRMKANKSNLDATILRLIYNLV